LTATKQILNTIILNNRALNNGD